MDKDIEEIMGSLRAFMQSPEYAQMQEIARQYKVTVDELNEAFRPHAEALQQLIIEVCEVLTPVIEELRQMHPEVDTVPLEEFQEAVVIKKNVDWQKVADVLDDIADIFIILPILIPSIDNSVMEIGAYLMIMAKLLKHIDRFNNEKH